MSVPGRLARSVPARSVPARLWAAIQPRWFLIALASLLAGGMVWHSALYEVTELAPRRLVVASVMFAMAITLQTSQIEAALRRPQAAMLASIINLGLLPPAAWVLSRTLPDDLAGGVLIAASVPCTLASAAIWTRRAGGNDAIALLVTLITNLVCFVVTPAWLWMLAGQVGPTESLGAMAGKLALLVALPIAAAQLLRRTTPLGRWAVKHKVALGVYSQFGILTIVLVGAVHCGGRVAGLSSSATTGLAWQVVLSVAIAAALHVWAWALGLKGALRLGMARPDAIAVAFAGSQKTLMVGIAIAVDWGGLAVLPMMAYHAVQLLVDTFLADRLQAEASRPPGPDLGPDLGPDPGPDPGIVR